MSKTNNLLVGRGVFVTFCLANEYVNYGHNWKNVVNRVYKKRKTPLEETRLLNSPRSPARSESNKNIYYLNITSRKRHFKKVVKISTRKNIKMRGAYDTI